MGALPAASLAAPEPVPLSTLRHRAAPARPGSIWVLSKRPARKVARAPDLRPLLRHLRPLLLRFCHDVHFLSRSGISSGTAAVANRLFHTDVHHGRRRAARGDGIFFLSAAGRRAGNAQAAHGVFSGHFARSDEQLPGLHHRAGDLPPAPRPAPAAALRLIHPSAPDPSPTPSPWRRPEQIPHGSCSPSHRWP